MASKHKKRKLTCKDWMLWWFSVIAGMINLAIVLPPLPWRFARSTPYFGSDFVSDRHVSLLMVSDNYGQQMLWFKMKTVVCQKAREVSAPTVQSMLKLAGMQGAQALDEKMDGNLPSVGGAHVGCDAWQECKNAAQVRCHSYGTIAGLGVGSVIFLLASAISGGVCLIFYYKEEAVKKKKKKEAAEFNTGTAAVFSFVFNLIADFVWCFGSDTVFTGFKSTAYYPYPAATAGYYMCWFTLILTGIVCFVGIRRQYHPEDHHSDDEHYDDGRSSMRYDSQYGAPPPYGSVYAPAPWQGAHPSVYGPTPTQGQIYAPDLPPPDLQAPGEDGIDSASSEHHHHHKHKHKHKHHD